MTKKRLFVIILAVFLSIIAGIAVAILAIGHLDRAIAVDSDQNSSSIASSEVISSVIQTVVDTESSEPEAPKPTLIFTSPSAKATTVTKPTVTFAGKSDPEILLSLGGSEVKRDDKGGFSFEKELQIGKNTFNFSYNGETVTYTVTYRYVVINSYSPSTAQIYSSGSKVGVEVKARNGSKVTATLNGQTITLSPASGETGDFVTFEGSFKLPADNYADLNLGKIKYTAIYNGITESFSSGKVTCKRPDFIVEYDPNATPIGGRYVNVGSGKIAEVVEYEAQTMDPGTTKNGSKPTHSYLPKGTVDYCAQEYVYSEPVNGEPEKYAVLRCGKQIYVEKKDTPNKTKYAVIKEYAGTLPDHNEVGIASFQNGTQHTVLTIDTMWKAPFYLDILPQKYTNPSIRDYTISQATYNYIDITFCYATVFNGEINLPADNPLFKSAKLIKNQSDCTLRLELKKQGAFYGWDANYNSQGQLVFEFLNPAKVTAADNAYGVDLTGVEILIDVGHGGKDPGALGVGGEDHTEAIESLALANKLKAELESIGAKVYMTRTSNVTSTNRDKIKMLKQIKPDYCIAIHHNSSTSSSANGFDACYYHPFAAKATKYIWQNTYNTGIYKKHKLYWHYYYMARSSYCPVVLSENGFISNSYDCNNIINDNVRLKKAKALAKGIAEYFLSIQ